MGTPISKIVFKVRGKHTFRSDSVYGVCTLNVKDIPPAATQGREMDCTLELHPSERDTSVTGSLALQVALGGEQVT